MSNAEKSDLMAYLTSRQLARAEDYQEKIKQAFRDKTEEAPELYVDIGFSLDDGIQSIDDYCAYLEKEYRDNLAFFQNCAAIRLIWAVPEAPISRRKNTNAPKTTRISSKRYMRN